MMDLPDIVIQQAYAISSKQKVASSEEAEQLILHGWQFVETLPNDKVFLEKGFTPTV